MQKPAKLQVSIKNMFSVIANVKKNYFGTLGNKKIRKRKYGEGKPSAFASLMSTFI